MIVCKVCGNGFKVNERPAVFDKEGRAYHYKCLKAKESSNVPQADSVQPQLADVLSRNTKLRFGDIVVNAYAGNSNPKKVLMYIKKENGMFICLSRGGALVKFDYKFDGFKIIGNVDFSGWNKLAQNFS